MHNKKGFQLSINMLVVIIISLVLFGAGLMIFNNIVDVAFKMEEDMTAQTETKLDNMMNDGSLVVALRTTVTESQGKTATFPIGFWNNKGEAQFEIMVESSNVPSGEFDRDPENTHQEDKWEAYFLQPPILGTNEDFKTLLNIYVPVNAKKGQYAFDISILNQDTGNLHGQKQRVYVIVP